jgi:hypothetical protein
MPVKEVTPELQKLRIEAEELGVEWDNRYGKEGLTKLIEEFKLEKVKEFEAMKEEATEAPEEKNIPTENLTNEVTFLGNTEPEPEPEPAPPAPPTSPVVMAPVHAQAEFAQPPKREIPGDVKEALDWLGGFSIGRTNIVSRYIESLL